MRRVLVIRLVQACVVLACITSFLILLRSQRGNAAGEAQNVKTEGNTPELRERRQRRVREFWLPFENGILAAKPACPPVQLARRAQAVKATPKDIFRDAPNNLVPEETLGLLKNSHQQFRQILDSGFDTQGRLRHRNINDLFKGQGVVTVAGGEYFGPAIVSILMLRRAGSKLPVEAFIPNKHEYEEEICETVLPTLNARCVILTDFTNSTTEAVGSGPSHVQLKSLALLFSSFKDVLYLDPNSLPLIDPHLELFAKEPYTSTGFVGWPDFWLGSESPLFYEVAGLSAFPSNLPATSADSGQLLIDKGRHLKTLLLATYYNVWGPDYYYPLLSQRALGTGEKNTFESAATVLGIPWYRVQTPVKDIGRSVTNKSQTSAMVQYHPYDDFKRHGSSISIKSSLEVFTGLGPQKRTRPAFIHANTPKMNAGHLADENGGLEDRKTREHLRIWGPKKNLQEIFGNDIEKITFRYIIESGCKYVRMLRDWEGRGNICKRLMEHYNIVFYNDS